MISYESIEDAYLNSIREVLDNGQEVEGINDSFSVGSHFGESKRDFIEIINHSFLIKNIRNKSINLEGRKLNYSFAFANILWVLTFDNSAKFITRFNKKGLTFSDDGKTINGATGYRIGHGVLEGIINKLKNDKSTRRAVLTIIQEKDLMDSTRDVPCNLTFQYFIRNNKLHCITNMRSQSVAFMLPYDLILYTFLQEVIAGLIGLEVGDYYHNSASFHIYCDEEKFASSIIKSQTYSDIPIFEQESISLEIFERIRLDIENDTDFVINPYWLFFKEVIRNGLG